MHFYHGWAKSIAAGEVLSDPSPRPYHSWHGHVARAAHAASGSSEPFDERVGRRIWNRWLGEKTFYQDPLYPYFLAGIYSLAGESVRAVWLVQSLLGLLCVALVYALGALLFDRAVALAAGLAAAAYGPLLQYELLLLRPVLIAAAGLGSLVLAIVAMRSPGRLRWPLLAGLAAGLSVLLKSSALLFAAWIALVLALRLRGQGPVLWRSLGVYAAGFLLALSPLAARNVAVGTAPLALAATGPITFINHNAVDYDPALGDALSTHAPEILRRTDGRFLPAAVETLRTHPDAASVLRLLAGKLLGFWHWYEVPNNASYDYFCLYAALVCALGLSFALVGPAGLAGLLVSLRRSSEVRLAAAFVGVGLASTLLFYHLARFRLPYACALIPFAAWTAVETLRAVRGRAVRRALLLCGATAAAALLVLRPLPQGQPRIRVADHGVGSQIVQHLARQRAAAGELRAALALVERKLEIQPAALRRLEPGSSPTPLGILDAQLAGAYAPLHGLAAELCRALHEPQLAEHHRRRARILGIVSEQLRSRSGKEGG
jgi:4-amino-4-deoxy-L-arabinose transferase-like glycosyltransferase